MATIRDPLPVKLGEFHTVELQRNNTLGSIRVDGGEPISGKSQVHFGSVIHMKYTCCVDAYLGLFARYGRYDEGFETTSHMM